MVDVREEIGESREVSGLSCEVESWEGRRFGCGDERGGRGRVGGTRAGRGC